MYKANVRAVLYNSETWSVWAEDLRRLRIFENRCLRSIAGDGWSERIRSATVMKRVLCEVSDGTIKECNERHQLRWLSHVLRILIHRLPRKALLS